MAMKIYQRLIRKPVQTTGSLATGSDVTGNAGDSGTDSSTSGSSNGGSATSHSQAARFTMPAGIKMLWCVALVFVFGLLPACSAPSTQRFAFAVRDGDTLLPVPAARATVIHTKQPFWYEGQPIYLKMDNVGMDHALLVLKTIAYRVKVSHEGYADACFNLPMLDQKFPFGQWLAAVHCEHPNNEPCNDDCQVSRLELMVTEPMPE